MSDVPCEDCIDQPIADHGDNPELYDEDDER